MKDLTLKFADRADFSAFMESIGYYDDESMQDDILIDVIGNVYKETGELTEDGEPVCVKEDGYFVNVRIINDAKKSSIFDEYAVAKAVMEVSAGTADACVVDITLANAMTGEGTNYDDLASGISLSSEEYGVGFRKESDLTDAFNKFMEKCLADGSLQALADKYSLTLVG